MIVYADKSDLVRKGGLFQFTVLGSSPSVKTSKQQEHEASIHMHSQEQRENECMHAVLSCFLHSCTVQKPLPRELRHPPGAYLN